MIEARLFRHGHIGHALHMQPVTADRRLAQAAGQHILQGCCLFRAGPGGRGGGEGQGGERSEEEKRFLHA
ncbi:hypothetical protein GCM10011317_42970 [Niveispirillum cyanobacteriorum]|nr:hypothetical protein GCM10011317_42970 [Niveispirillum cyanobacteriorum]